MIGALVRFVDALRAERVAVSPAELLDAGRALELVGPERRSEVNIVPGLAVIILTMTLVLFTAVALVRERERGNLELLITTPVHPLELMIGKLVPYIFVGLTQIIIILGLGWLVFNVPMQGKLHDLIAVTLPFIAASLTLGLLLSTIASTRCRPCR